ncbi:hypothetical protein [Pseudomonas fluorescens]|uniref:Uncharacterized protein n=1 Tax=Pseudomonas fluorescens TaxID=294 RepID=A0A109LGD4_PSEFL|nr:MULTISPECIES: hypothetical protein [Pseudomonas]KWV87171.1 hypothetical protein PFLmoz3_03019 [Pseudomonas fluorescens]
MIDLQKAYISQAIYVASNELDKRIRYKQEQAEEAFSSFISAQSQQTNLPDDIDPAQPRIIFQSGPKQIVISQIASQLSLGFDSSEKGVNSQLETVLKNVKEIHRRIEQFKGKESLKENALVITMSLPSTATRTELSEFIFSRFLNMPKFGEIASSSVRVGYLLDSGYFLNIEADVYEKRGGPFKATIGSTLDLMSLPIIEIGISVKIDINSRPKVSEPGFISTGPDEIINLVKNYFPGEIYKLLNLA